MPCGDVDVVFFCFGHGKSAAFLKDHHMPAGVKIIDLAQDFRIAGSHDYVYGLPETHSRAIRLAHHVANPGCFATCIQLAMLPALKAGILSGDIHVNGITGSTGAGQKPGATTHFSWRNDNISVYKTFTHQHLLEINQTVQELCPHYNGRVLFIPQRGCFANKALVYIEKHDDQLLMISCIDNLLKGAVGQAVQNMNLMFGIDEKSGLTLKASAF